MPEDGHTFKFLRVQDYKGILIKCMLSKSPNILTKLGLSVFKNIH